MIFVYDIELLQLLLTQLQWMGPISKFEKSFVEIIFLVNSFYETMV